MNKYDIIKKLPRKNNDYLYSGQKRWFYSFMGVSKNTGEKRHFFVEYCIINQKAEKNKPDCRVGSYRKPFFLLVRAGYWGKNPMQAEQYFRMDEIDIAPNFLKISAGDCFLSDNNVWGRITDEHKIMWSVRLDSPMAFHRGYCEGRVVFDEEIFLIHKGHYSELNDKKCGKDDMLPRLWMYSNQCNSKKNNRELRNSFFVIRCNQPKPFLQIFGEKKNYEINYSNLWTLPRIKYSAMKRDGRILWHIRASNKDIMTEIKISCLLDEMLHVNYNSPMGSKHRCGILSGGTGKGKVVLYQRKNGHKILVDKIRLESISCEYGKSF